MAEVKDKMITVESLSALHEHNKDTYLTKVDPTASGTFTMDGVIKLGNATLSYNNSENALEIVFVD